MPIGVEGSKNSADFGFGSMFGDYSMNSFNDMQGPQSSIDAYYGSVFSCGGFSLLGIWHGNSKIYSSFSHPLADSLWIRCSGGKQAVFPNFVGGHAKLWRIDHGALYDVFAVEFDG